MSGGGSRGAHYVFVDEQPDPFYKSKPPKSHPPQSSSHHKSKPPKPPKPSKPPKPPKPPNYSEQPPLNDELSGRFDNLSLSEDVDYGRYPSQSANSISSSKYTLRPPATQESDLGYGDDGQSYNAVAADWYPPDHSTQPVAISRSRQTPSDLDYEIDSYPDEQSAYSHGRHLKSPYSSKSRDPRPEYREDRSLPKEDPRSSRLRRSDFPEDSLDQSPYAMSSGTTGGSKSGCSEYDIPGEDASATGSRRSAYSDDAYRFSSKEPRSSKGSRRGFEGSYPLAEDVAFPSDSQAYSRRSQLSDTRLSDGQHLDYAGDPPASAEYYYDTPKGGGSYISGSTRSISRRSTAYDGYYSSPPARDTRSTYSSYSSYPSDGYSGARDRSHSKSGGVSYTAVIDEGLPPLAPPAFKASAKSHPKTSQPIKLLFYNKKTEGFRGSCSPGNLISREFVSYLKRDDDMIRFPDDEEETAKTCLGERCSAMATIVLSYKELGDDDLPTGGRGDAITFYVCRGMREDVHLRKKHNTF
ncbi:hypothetical protein B0H63DRAFT_461948 [Podospora didyma]|uniref:Uncharacterized protein n=1 Tax=Podospora didyma TaxID=330526 RepID=A0AAE0U8E4_9PEZI|nr:hypothetical protein B0H63DRAFT_461948 [Podospora didyma]